MKKNYGSGAGLDQDDSATGTHTDQPGLTVPQGPASWLDTNLSNPEMINFVPNPRQGTKITAKFKSKVFSFGHVLVDHNKLTLYQITEPLQSTSSATAADPAPYGTDVNGRPLNDPIPDTNIDPSTGLVTSPSATGTSALLDKWTVTKPEISPVLLATLTAPKKVDAGSALTYTIHLKNSSQYSLNGTQVRLALPAGVTFTGTNGTSATLQGNEVVLTIGRLAAGSEQTITIPVSVSADTRGRITGSATITSATALPVFSNPAGTVVTP